MSKEGISPIEALRVQSIVKDKLEAWCEANDYQATDGGADHIVIRSGDRYGLVAVSNTERKIVEPKYDYIVKQKNHILAIKGSEVVRIEVSGSGVEEYNVAYGAQAAERQVLRLVFSAVNAVMCKGYSVFCVDNQLMVATPSGELLSGRYVDTDILGAKGIEVNRGGQRLFGLIRQGVVIPPIYEERIKESEGLYLARRGGKYGYLSAGGVEVIPFIYEDAACFAEGLAAVCLDGRYGYIDCKGNTVIAHRYAYATSFAEGLGIVTSMDNVDSYIDRDGKVSIGLTATGYRFSEGFAAVEKDGKFGYINKQGELIEPYIYDAASSCTNGTVKVLDNSGTLQTKKLPR